MKIGLDLDNVIYDFVGEFKKFLRLHHGVFRDVLDKPITNYSIASSWGIEERKFSYWYDDFVICSGFQKGIMFPGTFDFVQKAKKENHQIYIITARNSSKCSNKAMQDTHIWLGQHLPSLDGIVFCKDKHQMECDIYLDDCEEVLESIKANRNLSLPVAYSRTWNTKWEGERVSDITEFYERYVKKNSNKEFSEKN